MKFSNLGHICRVCKIRFVLTGSDYIDFFVKPTIFKMVTIFYFSTDSVNIKKHVKMFFFLAFWSQNGKLEPPLPLWLLESKNAPILLRNEPLGRNLLFFFCVFSFTWNWQKWLIVFSDFASKNETGCGFINETG